ncbi:MAG: hypothetical protein LBT17_01290 [Mycoplasmataceae bacterium]|nr:hypothetical protein [Mycoplasmataceae bacterium]
MDLKKFNKFWWIGMGLTTGGILVLLIGFLLFLLLDEPGHSIGTVMLMICAVFLIPGIILWVYGAKDKFKKNPKFPKAALIVWITGLSVVGVGVLFFALTAFSLMGDAGGIFLFGGPVLAFVGLMLFIIFLTIWLVTRTKKHSVKISNTKNA